LSVEQRFDLRVAVLGKVILGLAFVVFPQHRVRVVDGGGVVLLDHATEPNRGFDDFKVGVKVALVKLINQDHRGTLVGPNSAIDGSACRALLRSLPHSYVCNLATEKNVLQAFFIAGAGR